jgi:hypothetical protein
MMRFAAGSMQQMIDPRTHNEIRGLGFAVEQMRCPIGDPLVAVNQQVIVDARIAGAGAYRG